MCRRLRTADSQIPSLSLGGTLLVNSMEYDWFGGTHSRVREEAYDFNPEVKQGLWDAINEQWNNPERRLHLIEGMFIDQDDKLVDGRLHRLHAAHVLAFLAKLTGGL